LFRRPFTKESRKKEGAALSEIKESQDRVGALEFIKGYVFLIERTPSS